MKSLTKIYLTAFVIVIVIIGAAFMAYKPAQQSEDIRLKTFASEQELKYFLQENAQNYQDYGYRSTAATVQEAAAPAADNNAKDYSQTNIQVEGVDEADFVKNDGKYIYIVSGNSLVIIDAYPAESAEILSNTTVENPHEIFVNGDSLVVFSSPYSYREPAVLGTEAGKSFAPDEYYPYRYEPKVAITIYDISDRSNPVVKKEFTVDGNYHDSRMIGSKFYAIINSYASYDYETQAITLPKFSPEGVVESFPQIYYPDIISPSYTFTNVVSFDTEGSFENKVFLFGSANVMYVSQGNIYITYEKYIPYYEIQGTLTEKALMPLLPADVAEKVRIAGAVQANPYNAQTAMQEELNKYLQTLSSEEQQEFYDKLQERMETVQAEIAKEQQKTVVHRISIKDGIKYEASGEFPGHLLNQFSMDEYNGNLRVATTISGGFGGPVIMTTDAGVAVARPVGSTQTTVAIEEAQTEEIVIDDPVPSPTVIVPPRPRSNSINNVYVLDSSLNLIGKLEDLAKGERIFSARFINERLYLVTFVQIDPLFVIDLSNPQQPKVLGELKIPGVSQYLHPYDDTHIIGVGQDAKDEQGRTIFSGVKVSLFDVSDVSAPVEIDNYIIGKQGTYTPVTYEHKAFLFDKQKNLMVVPVTINDYTDYKYQSWSGAYVFSFTSENKISLTGVVSHGETTIDPTSSYYIPNPSIERSLYIDSVLYTISSAKIKMNSLADLSGINEIDLPQQIYYYGYAESSSGVPVEAEADASGEVVAE